MGLQPCRRAHGRGEAALAHTATQHAPKPYTHLQTAIENSLTYDKCLQLQGDARASCQLDKALANVRGGGVEGGGWVGVWW